METKRIKQILSSTSDVEVQYNGTSVWIDKLHDDEKTVTVHLRGIPLEERTEVAVSDLNEM